MNLRYAAIALSISLLASVTIGCSSTEGEKASTLDRPTALALINAALRQGHPVTQDTTVHFADLVTRLTPIGRAPGMPQGQLNALDRSDAANHEFYNAMVSKSLIKEVPCQPAFNGVHCYAAIASESRETNNIYGIPCFDFIVAKPSDLSVTGIQQQGNEALADIHVENVPTEMT